MYILNIFNPFECVYNYSDSFLLTLHQTQIQIAVSLGHLPFYTISAGSVLVDTHFHSILHPQHHSLHQGICAIQASFVRSLHSMFWANLTTAFNRSPKFVLFRFLRPLSSSTSIISSRLVSCSFQISG